METLDELRTYNYRNAGKAWEIKAYTFNGEFICLPCATKAGVNSDGDEPKPVFSTDWNSDEILDTYGLEIFCPLCDKEIN